MGAINGAAATLAGGIIPGGKKPWTPTEGSIRSTAKGAAAALRTGDLNALFGNKRAAFSAYGQAGGKAANTIRQIDAFVKAHPETKSRFAPLRQKMEALRLEAFSRQAGLGFKPPIKQGGGGLGHIPQQAPVPRKPIPAPAPAPNRPTHGPF